MTVPDESIIAAVRAASKHRLRYFHGSLLQHRRHESFRVASWPDGDVGFTCSCTGVTREWRVSTETLEDVIPRAREACWQLARKGTFSSKRSNQAARQQEKSIVRRAKALLHRYLTKQQRWDLRAYEAITVEAGGRTFQLDTAGKVQVLVDGKPRYSMCIHPSEQLHAFDRMLAQKLMLEADPEAFFQTANLTDLRDHASYPNALFLLDGTEPEPVPEEGLSMDVLNNLDPPTLHDIDNPRPWIESLLQCSVNSSPS
jgi:hypothetical protein